LLRSSDYDISERPDRALIEYAALWENAMYGENHPAGRPAAEYCWQIQDFPIEHIADAPEDWEQWMRDEMKMWADDGDPDRFSNMFDRPIHEEVCLVKIDSMHAVLWDGYHRTAARHMLGEKTVKAIVGTLLPEYAEAPEFQAKIP